MSNVYLHIKSTNGEPFYVGKGTDARSTDKHSRNRFWKNTVNKHGFDVILLESGLTETAALEREIYWIARIGRKDLGLGPLVNLTDGGENPPVFYGDDNVSKRPEVRKILSDRMLGDLNPMFGKTHSEDWIQKNTWKNPDKPNPNQIQVECPHCGKVGGRAGLIRWHFDNCKQKNIN